MITIDLLKNHPESTQGCAEIWHEVLGKIWLPEISVEQGILTYRSLIKNNQFDKAWEYVANKYKKSIAEHKTCLIWLAKK